MGSTSYDFSRYVTGENLLPPKIEIFELVNIRSHHQRSVPRGQERGHGQRRALRRPGAEGGKRRRRKTSLAGSNTIKGSQSQASWKYVLISLQTWLTGGQTQSARSSMDLEFESFEINFDGFWNCFYFKTCAKQSSKLLTLVTDRSAHICHKWSHLPQNLQLLTSQLVTIHSIWFIRAIMKMSLVWLLFLRQIIIDLPPSWLLVWKSSQVDFISMKYSNKVFIFIAGRLQPLSTTQTQYSYQNFWL